jgi:hypothetical protein
MHWHGLLSAELAAAAVSIIVTFLMLPETKGKSLEEMGFRPEISHVSYSK